MKRFTKTFLILLLVLVANMSFQGAAFAAYAAEAENARDSQTESRLENTDEEEYTAPSALPPITEENRPADSLPEDVSIETIAEEDTVFLSRGGNDITGNVIFLPVDLNIVQGAALTPVIINDVAADPAPEIKVGDTIRVDYRWSIPHDQMTDVHDGSQFEIRLPDGSYIQTIEGEYDLLTDGGVAFGKYTVNEDKLIATLNSVAASQYELNGGFFTVYGSVIKAGEDIAIGVNGGVTVTVLPGGGRGGNHDSGVSPFPDSKIPFTKDGRQYTGQNTINWHMNINYDQLKNMVSGNSVLRKENTVLEDALPNDVSVDMSSIYITTPLFVPTLDNNMSGYAIGYPRIVPTVITPMAGESYSEFYARVQQSETPAVAVYGNKFLVAFGDLPGNGGYL